MPIRKCTKIPADVKTEAIRLAKLGYHGFPIQPGLKIPFPGSGGLNDATSDLAQIEQWWSVAPPSNIGLRCDGLLVLDVDKVEDKTKDNPWLTPERLSSLETAPNQITWSGGRQFIFRQPEGKHYRNTASVLAPHVDTRANGGYVVVPPSFVQEGDRSGNYRYMPGRELNVRPEELPLPPDWLIAELDRIEAERGKGKRGIGEVGPHQTDKSDPDAVERCRKYINKMPESVSGQGGHDATFAVACVCFRFGLSDYDAGVLLAEFNRRCEPEWSKAELLHKLKDAKETVTTDGEFGSLNKRKKGADDPGLIKDLADAISNENHFAQDGSRRLYHFGEGAYRPGGDEFVRQQVRTLCIAWRKTKWWHRKLADQVVEFLRLDSPRLWDRPPLDILNLQNGLLHVPSLELRPHDPAHLSPVRLPVAYDPAATCSEIEDYVARAFPADANSLAWEIPAYLMLPNNSIQKSLMFTGLSGNGKSTYLNLLQSFLGMENVSSVSLHDLVTDKFAPAGLVGKLANICGDLSREELPDVSVFKRFTGGDVINAQHKWGHPFSFNSFARFVFSANEIPKSRDTTAAYFDRWLVVPFPNSFRGQANEIPRDVLDARLAEPRELSGLLNNALQCFPVTRFSNPQSVRDATQKWRASAGDTRAILERFLAENTREAADAMVPKEELRAVFNTHLNCLEPPLTMTDTTFGNYFAALRPNVKQAQRKWEGKDKVRVYVGLSWKSS